VIMYEYIWPLLFAALLIKVHSSQDTSPVLIHLLTKSP
jgi:hypothetical protein